MTRKEFKQQLVLSYLKWIGGYDNVKDALYKAERASVLADAVLNELDSSLFDDSEEQDLTNVNDLLEKYGFEIKK